MAVPEQTPHIEHTGNGVTTNFALKFQCESKDHLIVLVDEIEPPIATWSLIGGDVVFTTAPAAGKQITLQRNTPFSRTTDYQSCNNSFRPPAVNKDFDWIWLKLQELGVADWILGSRIDALKNYVDRKDDELKAYLMEEIRKQGVALDQLDEYYNYLMQRLAQIAVDKGWDAAFVVDSSGLNQQEINDLTSHIEFYGATGGSDDSEAFYTAILNNKEIVLSSGKTYSLRLDNFDCQGNNVIIRGDGTARLKLIAGGGLTSALNVSSSNKAIISGVDVFTERSAISNIFTLNDTAFVGEVSSTNCNYSGFARFLSAIGSKTQLFETAPFGIGRLVFSDNTSIDSQRGMIYISDMPVLDAEIYRNNVTNFSGQFISINITNNAPNTASVTRNRNIRAKHNTVHCTDDFWMTSSHSQYYTFLLFEGLEAVWTDNDISGMKTEVAGVVVYDTYLYAVNPTIKNNTWKNIAGFSDNDEGNRIIQAKAESVGEFKCVKVITDNTYVIEDEWLARIGKSSCTHRLYRLGVDNCGDVTFSRNTFKLNTLTDSSIHKGEKFVLEGNQITAKSVLSSFSLFWFSPLSTDGSLLKLKGNGFKTLDKSSSGGIFLSANPSSPAWGELVIEDNTGDFGEASLTTFLNEVSSSKTRILRNTITGSFADLNYLNAKWLSEFLIEGNNFICTRASGARPHVGFRPPTKGFLEDTFIGVHEYIRFPVYRSQINVIESPLTYLVSVELYTKTGKTQVEFTYSLTYESGVYKASFVDNLDATVIATLETSEADNTVVKSALSGSLPLSVLIRNTVDGASFRINGVPASEYIKSVISINAF